MLDYLRNHPWTSAHGTVSQIAERIAFPKNLDENGNVPASEPWRAGHAALLRLVEEADAADAALLPMGSGWSLSDVLRAPERAWRVVTSHLNRVAALGLSPEHLAPGSPLDRRRLVFVQGGITVYDLHRALVPHGLSLPTTGASCGQTLAGALSTGTHGSAIRYGSMTEMVRGIHLVVGPGRSVWLEPASRPAASDAFCAHLGAEALRDDALFAAALVAFGAMGIVHGYLLETEPLFLLRRHFVAADLDELAGLVRREGDRLVVAPADFFPEDPDGLYHFEIVLDPNDRDGDCVLNLQYRIGLAADYAWRDLPPPGRGVGDDVLIDVAGIAHVLGAATSPFVRARVAKLLAESYPPGQTKVGILAEMFPRTQFPSGGQSTEIGVDAKHWARALEVVLKAVRRPARAFAGLIGVRFVPRSSATLGFTRFPVTCTIELPAGNDRRILRLYRKIWEALQDEGIPFTLHWGQAAAFDRLSVEAMYGTERVRSWKEARRTLLGAHGAWRFRNGLLDAAGL